MSGGGRSRFSFLVGEWKGKGEIFPNPWGGFGPTDTTWLFEWDRSGTFLLCDCLEVRSDGSTFSAHGILGIDPGDGVPLWWLFDSYGYPPYAPATGTWEDDKLVLTKDTPRGTGRTSFAVRDRALEVLIESRSAGDAAFIRVMAGAFARVQ